MSPLQIQLDRIRRRLWLVLAVTAIALVGTVLYSVSQKPVYTSTMALRVDSQTRGPEQDAVLAQGYVEYFNQPSAKQVVRAKTGLSADVAFSARTSATSPILYIEAAAPNADLAVASARRIAETFREDINTQVRQSNERIIADLRAQISALQDRLKTLPSVSTEFSLILQELVTLRKSINDLKASTTNQLRDVLPSAGVSSASSNVLQNAALALAGGLILGVVAALMLASVEDRPATPQEVREPAPTLARVTDRRSAEHDLDNGVITTSTTGGEESRA